MINEKKKRQLQIEKEQQQTQNQLQVGLSSPISKSGGGFFTPRKSENHVSSVCSLPPPPPVSMSSRQMLSMSGRTQKLSKWRRFINFFTCCDNDQSEIYEQENNGASSQAKISNISKSFKSSIQSDWNGADAANGQNSGAKDSIGSQMSMQYRNTSNSNPILYNIQYYKSSGFAQMYFGHYSFFQIPVKFEQHQYTSKRSFSDEFGRLFSGNHVLVAQTYLDWEFVGSISKHYSFVFCAFASYLSGIPPPNIGVNGVNAFNTNLVGSGGQQKNISPTSTQLSSPGASGYNYNLYTKIPDTIFQKQELQNTEFLNCSDLSYTVNFELFDKILVIPTSLKSQGNSFDVNFNMKPEFRHVLQEQISTYIDILDKVVFILPKYSKIKEVMLIIYDAYYKSTVPIYDLNFGIQFHSFADEFGEVECLALVFNTQQHLDTMSAISQRIFSNINPNLPVLALPSSRNLEESSKQQTDLGKSNKLEESQKNKQAFGNKNKLEQSQKNKLEESSKKKKGQSLEESQRSTRSKKQSEDEFTVSEDIYSNKEVNSNQKPVSEFFEDEYIIQIGQTSFKSLYNFLRELNTQFIIQDHVFYYRTHVIDVMLKNNVIQQTFVQTLVSHFAREDLLKQANLTIATNNIGAAGNGKTEKPQKKNKKNDNNKNNKLTTNTDFKEFFQKNSQHFTLKFEEQDEKSESQLDKVYSPSYYEYQSETTTDQDYLHFGDKSSQTTHNILQIQVHNSLPKTQNQLSHPTEVMMAPEIHSNHGSQQVLNTESVDSETAPARTRIRQKQISCNYYTTGSKNRHIGFKSNKLSQSTLDEDILNRTTASRIFGDKKLLKDNGLIEADVENKSNSKKFNPKFIQDVIPEEIYSNNATKMLRNRNFSQD